MAKETVPKRRYTDEYKQEALRLAETVGINQAAQRLAMPASSLGNWMRHRQSGKLPPMSAATPIKG
jgi:transposase